MTMKMKHHDDAQARTKMVYFMLIGTNVKNVIGEICYMFVSLRPWYC